MGTMLGLATGTPCQMKDAVHPTPRKLGAGPGTRPSAPIGCRLTGRRFRRLLTSAGLASVRARAWVVSCCAVRRRRVGAGSECVLEPARDVHLEPGGCRDAADVA